MDNTSSVEKEVLPPGFPRDNQLDALIHLGMLRDALATAVHQSSQYLKVLPEGVTRSAHRKMHENLENAAGGAAR